MPYYAYAWCVEYFSTSILPPHFLQHQIDVDGFWHDTSKEHDELLWNWKNISYLHWSIYFPIDMLCEHIIINFIFFQTFLPPPKKNPYAICPNIVSALKSYIILQHERG